MGFRTGSYAKVWEVRPRSATMTELRVSVSRKNKESGEYEQDFGGYVRCVGQACASQAAALAEGDRIRFGDVDVTRRYDKEAQKEYTNFTVFSFEKDDGMTAGNQTAQAGTAAPKQAPTASYDSAGPDGGDDELPF